jgi:hypothetical protein
MPTYKYEALATSGVEVKDSIEASNAKEARQKVKEMGYFLTKLVATSGSKIGTKAKKRKTDVSDKRSIINGVDQKMLIVISGAVFTFFCGLLLTFFMFSNSDSQHAQPTRATLAPPAEPQIPEDHVKLILYMPASSDVTSLSVLINNSPVGYAKIGQKVVLHFPPGPDGNNTIKFVNALAKSESNAEGLYATPGAELNATITYTHKTFDPDIFKLDVTETKRGQPVSYFESAVLDPTPIRREAHKETVNGPAGTRYAVQRKRTIEREITISETAQLDLSVGVKRNFGLVELKAGIRSSLAKSNSVLLRDKEEISQSVEVVFDYRGTATLVWIDNTRKGNASYKFNGHPKTIEFEVVYSSELTISRN